MTTLLTIDPSLRSLGWARFDSGVLKSCGVQRSVAEAPNNVLACRIVQRLAAHIVDTEPAVVVCEWPQIYQRGGGRTKGDPNDLLGLAGVCAAAAAIWPRAHHVLVRPAEWKGQLGKEQSHARVRSRLSPEELALWPDSPDARDAVGIGLFALNRFARRRVFAGAT